MEVKLKIYKGKTLLSVVRGEPNSAYIQEKLAMLNDRADEGFTYELTNSEMEDLSVLSTDEIKAKLQDVSRLRQQEESKDVVNWAYYSELCETIAHYTDELAWRTIESD